MTRRTFALAILLSVVVVPLVGEAQEAAAVHRRGYLELNRTDVNPRLSSAFREGLRSLGYVEGRNVVIEHRSAEGKPERLSALAAELVALKSLVDVGDEMHEPAPRSDLSGPDHLHAAVERRVGAPVDSAAPPAGATELRENFDPANLPLGVTKPGVS